MIDRRKRLGLTQREAARRAGISPGRLSEFESGLRNLPLDQWWALLAVLRVRTRVEAEIVRALRR